MSARPIAGLVLAGGASRRFGSDKALAVYRGQTLLDWAFAAVETRCAAVFLAGREHRRAIAVNDQPGPDMGPLGGICGGLFAARRRGFSHVLSVPCDTPALPGSLLDRLIGMRDGGYVAVCPVIALWPTSLADHLDDHLRSGRPRAVQAWAVAAGITPLAWDAPVLNINHPCDLPPC